MFRPSSGKARVFSGLIFLISGTGLVSLCPFVTRAATVSFTKNFTLGSTGLGIVTLQQFLISQGFSTKPTGYFGPLTKSALIAYQKAHTITPAAGYFGPLTRAAINAELASVLLMTSTPASVASATTSENVTANSTTQSGTINLSSDPISGQYIFTSIDAPVYGLRFQVSGAPVTLNRFDLQVQDYQGDTIGTNAENPATFINVIKIWNGSNLVGSWSISPTSGTNGGVGTQFIQSTSDASVYYVRLSGLNYTLLAGTTTALTVTFGTTGASDIDRTLIIQGYAGELGTNVAVISGGTQNYYGADGANFKVTKTFKGRVNPIVSMTGDPLLTSGYGNYVVDSANGLTAADLSVVDVSADDGDIYITDVTANVTASGTPPTNITLYDTDLSTSTPVAAMSPSGLSGGPFGAPTTGTVSFHNLHLPVSAGTKIHLDFQADMPGGIVEGSNVSVGDTNTTITYQTSFGSSVTLANASPGLYPSYFYTAAPVIAFVSGTASSTTAKYSGSTSLATATFVVTFTPQTSDMNLLSAADITVDASPDSVNFTNIPNVSVDVSPTPTSGVYARGQTYTATITAVTTSDLSVTGSYLFYLDGLNWSMRNGVAMNPTYFFGNLVYDTNATMWVK